MNRNQAGKGMLLFHTIYKTQHIENVEVLQFMYHAAILSFEKELHIMSRMKSYDIFSKPMHIHSVITSNKRAAEIFCIVCQKYKLDNAILFR